MSFAEVLQFQRIFRTAFSAKINRKVDVNQHLSPYCRSSIIYVLCRILKASNKTSTFRGEQRSVIKPFSGDRTRQLATRAVTIRNIVVTNQTRTHTPNWHLRIFSCVLLKIRRTRNAYGYKSMWLEISNTTCICLVLNVASNYGNSISLDRTKKIQKHRGERKRTIPEQNQNQYSNTRVQIQR